MNLNFLKFNQRTTDAISIKMKWAPEGKSKTRDRKNHLGTLGKKYLKNRQKIKNQNKERNEERIEGNPRVTAVADQEKWMHRRWKQETTDGYNFCRNNFIDIITTVFLIVYTVVLITVPIYCILYPTRSAICISRSPQLPRSSLPPRLGA